MKNTTLLVVLFLSLNHTTQAVAQEPTITLDEAIKASKILADLRLRYEGADFSSLSDNAQALTYRARIGLETGSFLSTKFLIEVDHVQSIVDDFNSTTNGNTTFPVIADPNVTELNRLQLTNSSLPETQITIGRQRIILDDSRFVGNVGWRQNEQTYDAVRVVNTSIKGLKLDGAYIDQVNRIFGDDSAQGRFNSNSWLLSANYIVPIEGAKLKLGTHAYLLDLSNTALSSQTYGANASFSKGIVTLKAAYAAQSDYGNQPVAYNEEYYLLEVSAKQKGFSGSAGYEVLSGDGSRAFTTPLATLHKFNGFADVFLSTPTNGLKDSYVKLGYKSEPIGALKYINVFGVYHDFNSENTSNGLGSEIDAVIATQIGKTKVLFKYANYDADSFATSRERYSVQLDYKF